MSVELTVQLASQSLAVPQNAEFQSWAEACFPSADRTNAITIRIVDEPESQLLNNQYRGKDSATNVLSFPSSLPEEVQLEVESESGLYLVGDLVICAGVVNAEAVQQQKNRADHWAHMTVHGVLHLLGYDHQKKIQAERMENREKEILSRLGILDPYEER